MNWLEMCQKPLKTSVFLKERNPVYYFIATCSIVVDLLVVLETTNSIRSADLACGET